MVTDDRVDQFFPEQAKAKTGSAVGEVAPVFLCQSFRLAGTVAMSGDEIVEMSPLFLCEPVSWTRLDWLIRDIGRLVLHEGGAG